MENLTTEQLQELNNKLQEALQKVNTVISQCDKTDVRHQKILDEFVKVKAQLEDSIRLIKAE